MTLQDTAVGLDRGAIPLVETKLMPPRPRPTLVSRPRLHEALDALASAELTLISAPAGSGKTVLLGSWCAFQSRASVAWVSLDAADDDPVRLWTYIATAVDRIRPGLGRMALLRLRTPGVALETCVDELLNGVSAYGEPLALALDDLHVLRSATCLESLEYAIEHLPRNARVIATARADPPIALARLRGGDSSASCARATSPSRSMRRERSSWTGKRSPSTAATSKCSSSEARAGRLACTWRLSGSVAPRIRRKECVSSAATSVRLPTSSTPRSWSAQASSSSAPSGCPSAPRSSRRPARRSRASSEARAPARGRSATSRS